MTAAEIRAEKVEATVIGFLADTHCKEPDGSDLPQEVFDAFEERGVGLIVHVGHYGHPGLLDRLAASARVVALNTQLDQKAVAGLQGEAARRVAGFRHVLEAAGMRIGLEFDFSGNGFGTKPEDPPLRLEGRKLGDVLAEKFGGPVDIVGYANQHVDRVFFADWVLMFNPGSPNLPGGDRKGGLGTVAVLRIDDGIAELEIVDLERRRLRSAEVAAGA